MNRLVEHADGHRCIVYMTCGCRLVRRDIHLSWSRCMVHGYAEATWDATTTAVMPDRSTHAHPAAIYGPEDAGV